MARTGPVSTRLVVNRRHLFPIRHPAHQSPAPHRPAADPDDLEHDIHTTCEDMNRPHCPYDTNHEQNSILCEWKAKGATNWMVRSTVKGKFIFYYRMGNLSDG